jgi:cytochrome c
MKLHPHGLLINAPALLLALTALGALGALTALGARADEPVGFVRGTELAAKYRCQSCHDADKTLSGPSFRDVAKRYADDPHAREELANSILNGSSGAWGTPLAMPATPVPDGDLRPLVEWILSLRQ